MFILGSGPLEESLRFKVKNLKLSNEVLFLGDVVNEEVPRYLAIADIFVRPSLAEGLGNAFLEAMAAGVPVIGTKVGGIPDFLVDCQTGIFCEVKDPQGIAEKIRLILSDSALRDKIVENAKELVEQKYNWDLIAEKMKNILFKVINH